MQFFTGFSQYNFNKTRYMHVVYSCSDGGGGDDDLEDADLVERQVDFDRLLSGDPYRHTDRRTDQATQTHRHTDKDTQTKNWQEWAAVGAHNDRELYDGQVYTFFLIFFCPQRPRVL